MSAFDYEIDVEVQFRDIDAMGHVNNATICSYLEQARVRYVEDVVGEGFMDVGIVIANLEIEFQRPINWGDDVTVAVRATDLSTSSIPLVYEVRVDGDVAATAETLLVTFDKEAGESRPMPDAWREAIAAHEGL
jgi:acyl-CoA thioester hydrolase